MNYKKISIAVLIVMLMAFLTVSVAAEETTYAASVGEIRYSSVAEAVEAANGEVVTLLTDSAENVTVSGDLYLDLNGHTLAGLTVTDGTLYGMDSATDDYDCSDGYGKITNLTGSYAAHHQTPVAGNPQRYLTVAEEGGVSFHRIYLGITHKSLQPAKQGVGYKAVFAADTVAAAEMESYGYTLWLDGCNKVTRWKDAESFVSGDTLSLRVQNYDAENYGETTLYAAVQLKLTDGTVISTDEQGMTLKDTFALINANVSAYTETQLEALGAWIMTSDTMLGWDVANILQSDLSYDMNAGKDLVVYTEITGTLQSVTVKDMGLTLANATLQNGVLTIPAASFVQDTMPSGKLILEITTDFQTAYCVGDFTWVIHNWDELAYMEKHLVKEGNVYTGALALGADVDVTGKNISNFAMFRMANEFDGTFDGRNHTITGLKPAATTALFGTVGTNGVVENLKLTGVQITTYGGGVAYICNGTLRNIYVEGTITGDGMDGDLNLSNFGSGLLAGIYNHTAKVDNCIVEVTSIANGLRLATAFGRMRTNMDESIFTYCNAVNADGYTFMQGTGDVDASTWTKESFSNDYTNMNFATMSDLWRDSVAAALAAKLGLENPNAPKDMVLSESFDMNITGNDLVVENTKLTGTLQSVTVEGTAVTLNATLANGTLTIPNASFKQDTMPSGNLSLVVTTDSEQIRISGEFVWVLHSWNDMAYMEKHLVAGGSAYTGSLALAADIDLAGKEPVNFLWKTITVFNGTFDGRYHTLSNYNAKSAALGLFKELGAESVVKNLKMTGVTVSTYSAGVAYIARGTLENIYVQGAITADGMNAGSDLANFGSGLLAGIYNQTAKVDNCIVEVTSIADGLRLATAFGRLRNGVSESIFSDCYAIGAANSTFMQMQNDAYTKVGFTTDSNVNFAVYTDLWKHADARALAQKLGLDKPTDTVTLSGSYDMHASNEDLVITGLEAADITTTAYVKGTDIVLKDVTVSGGTLRIPAASFVQKLMPSGDLTLVVELAEQNIEISGHFVWIIDSWANGITGLAYMHNHLSVSGSDYYGSMALSADIALGTGNPANFTMGQSPAVFQGVLDGRGHTVSGFAVKSPARSLFYQIGENGTVKNLNMTDVTVSTYAAPIAYICKGTLQNIFVQGVITADAIGATSNLSNFGCSLLAGQYYASAKVDGCMVELSSIASNLRLATAFGKLREGVTESIFTNCDAIGANGCTYMHYTDQTWKKADFTASTNHNYADRAAIMASADGALRYIALRPAVDFVEQDTHDYTVSDAVHSYQITDTDQFIDSTYSIVISKTADEDTQTAANDFASLFRTATGLRIAKVYAENVTYSASSKYIVIGDNAVSKAAGVAADDLGTQGFRIRTVGSSIFVVGADPQGTQYGVYELLYQLFHYDCFGIDGYTIDKNVTQIPLKNYDITDVPDIGIRRSNYHYLTMDSVTERRMRLTYFGDYIIPVGEKMVHNSSQYISKEDYPDKTDWFSTDGVNLCYTAHGNAAEKAQMQTIIANIIIEKLEANPDKNAIGMMQEDNSTLCDCESCTAMQEHYNGAQVASVIIFLNRVCELVDEHFGGERDFTVLFFAYHATSQPPVVYDAQTGTYAPVDDRVLLNSHLKPFFADTDGDYTKDFYNADTANAEAAEQMNGWMALSEDMHFWMYGTNFSFYLIPYNTFDAMQANYKYAIEHGADFIYDQGQASQSGTATGWSNLKIYLYSKLTWNVNQDREELIDRFMEGYYGPAADTVKDVFYSWKFVANYQTNELGFIGSRTIYKSLLKKEYWNQAVLIDWATRLEQAMQEVAHLQSTDPDSYAKYMKNIAAERIAYNFLLLELFQDTMTQEQIQTAKDQFYHDYQLTKIGYQQDREEPVSDLLIKWGIIEATS